MTIIRLAISAFLVWKVAHEAGPWTAASIALLTAGIEAAVIAIRKAKR